MLDFPTTDPVKARSHSHGCLYVDRNILLHIWGTGQGGDLPGRGPGRTVTYLYKDGDQRSQGGDQRVPAR